MTTLHSTVLLWKLYPPGGDQWYGLWRQGDVHVLDRFRSRDADKILMVQHAILQKKGDKDAEQDYVAVDMRKQLGRTHRQVRCRF